MSRITRLVPLCLLLAWLCACAGFRGGELPERSPEDLAVGRGALPSASVDLRWLTKSKPNPNVREQMAPRVLAAFEASGVFASVREGSGGADYDFSISIDNTGNTGVAAITGFLSGLTLFAFPGYAKDEYTMEVAVSRRGVPVRELSYQDDMTSIIQWLMVFFMPTNGINSTVDELLQNMVFNLLYDLEQEGVLAAD